MKYERTEKVCAKEAHGFGSSDWMWKVYHAKPSGGGAVGVTFVWCRPEERLYAHGVSYDNPGTADFIVKPIYGGAAAIKFAEYMIKGVALIPTTNSKPIERNSRKGRVILDNLKNFQGRERPGTALRSRWDEVMRHYESASYFLLQDVLTNITEMGDEMRTSTGLRHILRDEAFMKALGQLFAADAVIGNGDRLCNLNTGNILYNAWNRGLVAIDSSTVLVNYNDMLNDPTVMSWGDFQGEQPGDQPSPQFWNKTIMTKVGLGTPSKEQLPAMVDGYQPRVLPGFKMNDLFDPDRWFKDVFRDQIEDRILKVHQENVRLGNNVPPPVPPREFEWEQAKLWFKQGLDVGIRAVDEKLSGFNWLKVKIKHKLVTSKYGGSENVDWTNFKVRRMYIKARARGQSAEQAMQTVTAYVARKFPGL